MAASYAVFFDEAHVSGSLQEIAEAIPEGSIDWSRGLRCLGQALRSNPPSDWWRRALMILPSLRVNLGLPPGGGPLTGSLLVVIPELNWHMTVEALVERTLELMQPPDFSSGEAFWKVGAHAAAGVLIQ